MASKQGEPTGSVPDAKAKASAAPRGKAGERQYEPGRWDDCRFFMPSLTEVGKNRDALADFRQRVLDSDYSGVKLILNAGFPANYPLTPGRERTGLHLSAEAGDMLMCKLLLEFKANPYQNCKMIPQRSTSAVTLTGRTPMDIAKVREHVPVVHLFSQSNLGRAAPPELDRGIDPPARIEFPLRLELKANEPGLMGPRETRQFQTSTEAGCDTEQLPVHRGY